MDISKIKTSVNVETVVKVLDEITPEEFKETEVDYTYIVSIKPEGIDIGVAKLEYSLDMFFEIGGSDIEKLELMQSIQNNKLFPCTTAEAQEVSAAKIIPPMHAMRARVNAHPGMTLHLFKTKFQMKREDFEMLLSIIDVDESTKTLFMDSKF